ncbi:MAG TPA: PQQ-binding-like beta-propeller repeat protein, partial [Myxococcaceae bacterium]|nr:PQQ-binding-like beta-propeller repeat protein [Myxococcaceae bacterium]
TLYALDVKNGSVRWTFAASQELATPPVLVGGRLYFASHNDTVYALEASSGTWKWQYRRDPPAGFTVRGMSTPRVKDGLVYAGFSDGSVVALKAEDGAVRWERVLSSSGSEFLDADGGPVLDDEGQLYVASYRDGIYALDAASGEVRWHTPRDGVTSLVRRPGVIYAAGERGVGAFLQDSGRQVWTLPLGESAARLPVPSHKMLVVPINQALLFVDPLRGKTELAWDPGAGVSAPPAPWGRRLYVLSNTGFLYALKLKGGA